MRSCPPTSSSRSCTWRTPEECRCTLTTLVGPALFDQPRTLQLGVDVVATGLDKYGTVGPRLGVMAGEKSLVSRIRARAFEMGLEARPFLYPAAVRSLVGSTTERVQELVDTTREVAAAIKDALGDRLHETAVI